MVMFEMSILLRWRARSTWLPVARHVSRSPSADAIGVPDDQRNLWPEAVQAVRELRPKAFIFENVRGLLRPAFHEYLQYLKLYLSWPDIAARDDEAWIDHLTRVRNYACSQKHGFSDYIVRFQGINTADFGAAQKRHRAIVIGVRTDISTDWTVASAHLLCFGRVGGLPDRA